MNNKQTLPLNIRDISNENINSKLGADEKRALNTILEWIHNFLCNSHPDLGRQGIVCPYTPSSLKREQFWITFYNEYPITINKAMQIILECKDFFKSSKSSNDLLNVLLILFPNKEADNSNIVEKLQKNLKKEFVSQGLMLGQFFPNCMEPGLWNSDFRPLQAPIPLLAIRNMVSSDFPFLSNEKEFVLAYIKKFGNDIPAQLKKDVEDAINKYNISFE